MMKSFVLVALASVACAQITVSRTVEKIDHAKGAVTLSAGCTGKDDYGSNDCTLDWLTNYTVTAAVELDEDITAGTLSVDLKLEGIFPLSFSCPVCNGVCSTEIPIVKKTISFKTPPCPISHKTINNATMVSIPKSSGISATVTGTITVTDQNKDTILEVSIDAKIKA